MPLHALELLPDQAGQEVLRRDWRVLSEAGLKSQLEHRGAGNAPHLTLVAAAAIGPEVDELAVELISPLLPIRVRSSGLLLLGARRLTVARVVDVEDHVVAADRLPKRHRNTKVMKRPRFDAASIWAAVMPSARWAIRGGWTRVGLPRRSGLTPSCRRGVLSPTTTDAQVMGAGAE